MKAKSISKRINDLEERLHPRKPVVYVNEDELREGLLILLGFVPPSFILTHLKEKEPVVMNDSEQAQKEYKFFVEEFLDCGRSIDPYDEENELLGGLWELEKKFAKKENRKANFGVNVLFVDKADDEFFKRLRASCKIPPLSAEHRKAINEVMAKIGNEKPTL
jgi:hypothetical protein